METKARILFLDDEPIITGLIELYFKEMDYDITVLNCPRRALEEFNKKSFDILIVDQVMPGLKGTELLSSLKGRYRFAILFTAHLAEDVLDAADGLIDIIIEKPLKLDKLQGAIDKAIDIISGTEKSEDAR